MKTLFLTLLKNFFFINKKENHKQENANVDELHEQEKHNYDEYLHYYAKVTRWPQMQG